jgi:hypothetical protein
VWPKILDHLRGQVRQQAGRQPEPSLLIADSQSVPITEKGPRGYDRHKCVKGRKRHIVVASQG